MKILSDRPAGFIPHPNCKLGYSGAGFTLIEIMIAAVIFSVVSLAIGATFMSGMKLYQRAQKANFEDDRILLEIEAVSKELRQGINISKIGFEGSSEEFTFASIIGDSIYKITYKTDMAGKAVKRSIISLKDISELKEEAQDKTVFANTNGFKLSYFRRELEEYGWNDKWEKIDGWPVAVKLEVSAGEKQTTRIVLMPVASVE